MKNLPVKSPPAQKAVRERPNSGRAHTFPIVSGSNIGKVLPFTFCKQRPPELGKHEKGVNGRGEDRRHDD